MAINLRNRNMLTLKQYTPQEIKYLLDLAADLKNKKRLGIKGNLLEGKNIALIFEKTSTRTRSAFTVGIVDEGGHAEFLGINDIHLGKNKEDVPDTARVLGRMFDGIEFRGYSHKTLEDLAKYSGVPVWNGLTDDYHPAQALADLLTIRDNFGKLKGVKCVYVGDGSNNVSNSLMIAASKMGMYYVTATDKSLFPDPQLVEECKKIAEISGSGATIEITDDVKTAVKGADALYTDVWASMGEEDKLAERKAILRPFQVNMDLIKATGNEDVIFLHCLPAVKGNEVTEEVFESHYGRQFDQAENRMHTIKAVMVATIGNI